MSEFSERNPSPGRLHVSAEPLMEQMEEKQEKCDILSLGELMFQFNSPGVPHDETETQLKTEQTSSCEPAKNQEPAPQSCLNQEPAPQSCLNKEPAPQSCLNQEPAPQSCLNQEPAPQSCLNKEPAPQSSLTKPGPKKKRKQKPAKNLQGGLEEPKTPIKSFSTSERGKSPPIAPAQASLSSTETQQRSPDEPISGNKSTLEDLPLVKGDDIKCLLTSFWENLQAEDVSEQKTKAKMEHMFKDLICVSANEVLRALVTRKSLYECSPGKVQVSQTGVKGSLSPVFRTFIKTPSTEEFIALDRVIKLLSTEVALTVNSVLKDNCGFERVSAGGGEGLFHTTENPAPHRC
uniref:Uncharacterized protein n=1 Tax=Knipowitschia caucasica TaxID=637954 RepID=A0AAV2L797_KNICA